MNSEKKRCADCIYCATIRYMDRKAKHYCVFRCKYISPGKPRFCRAHTSPDPINMKTL